MKTCSIGIYCTVRVSEFKIAMKTLGYAACSPFVTKINILLTDSGYNSELKITEKITLFSSDFGSGYDVSIDVGGYNQIAARNYILSTFKDDISWVMMHDADDLYSLDFYEMVSKEFSSDEAVVCGCYSLRHKDEMCFPTGKVQSVNAINILDPHVRVWKKSLKIKYVKSEGVEKYFHNHSRHCGVVFPLKTKMAYTSGLYHFHLHALLNKRHNEKINNFERISLPPPDFVNEFLHANKKLFHNH